MQKLRIIGLVFIVITFGFTLIVSGQEAVDEICVPMGSFPIEPPEGVTARRPSVDFPHSQHFDFSCKTCHHKWDFEGPIVGCTTSGCHDAVEPVKKTEMPTGDPLMATRYYKDAYHQQCLECHKEIRKQNLLAEKKLRISDADTQIKKAGPLSCKQCHKEE
jgi:hypothetical protein